MELDKLDIDRAIMRYFHYVSQVTICYISLLLLYLCSSDKFFFLKAVVIGSSLASHSREMRDVAMVAQANIGAIRYEMILAQGMAKEMEDRVTNLEAENQCTIGKLQKLKDDNVATLERLEKGMANLKE